MTSKAELRNPTPEDRCRLLEAADRIRRTRQLEERIRELQAKQEETSPEPNDGR